MPEQGRAELAERAAQATHDYLTTDEVAERYRRPASTIRYWRHIKYGPVAVRAGGRVLYPAAEIQRFDRQLAAEAGAASAAS